MARASAIDPVRLAQALIRHPSVTPTDAGALDLLERTLSGLGFNCWRLPFEEPGTDPVDNLYARFGRGAPHFAFAGHTDVVPPGDAAAWTRPPFSGEIAEGFLHGRGAADMKGGIAAFVAAAARFLAAHKDFAGSISLIVTGDEEGPSVNGTVKMLDWMRERGERPDACLVGEPTNPERLGESVKVGRRGSLSVGLTVMGVQGHVAYPERADNPIPRLLRALGELSARRLDGGNADFQPSNLEITSIDVGNPAMNVIPASATAAFNIRFNTEHARDDLIAWIREVCARHAGEEGKGFALRILSQGDAFVTPPGSLRDLVADAVAAVLGRRPEMSTSGGTSDARFIKDLCPVVEFGLAGQTMHKVDERVAIADIERLAEIYRAVLERFFG